MLMRLNFTIASLIWGITLLFFVLIGEKTANLSLFLGHLDLQKARDSEPESASLAVFSLQITAKTAGRASGLPMGAAAVGSVS